MSKNKTLEEIWHQVPADYYEKGIKTNPFQFIWHNWKWHTMAQILKKTSPTPIKILDVGCSSGHVTAKLATFFPGSQVYGVDSYERAISFGKKQHPEIKFLVADAHKLPFKAKTFDLVSCIETLEHLEDPEKALREIFRVIKPAGKLLIGQDTDNWLFKVVWFVWTKTRGKVWTDSHIHPLNSEALEKLIKKLGFKIKIKKFSQASLEVFFFAIK